LADFIWHFVAQGSSLGSLTSGIKGRNSPTVRGLDNDSALGVKANN